MTTNQKHSVTAIVIFIILLSLAIYLTWWYPTEVGFDRLMALWVMVIGAMLYKIVALFETFKS